MISEINLAYLRIDYLLTLNCLPISYNIKQNIWYIHYKNWASAWQN